MATHTCSICPVSNRMLHFTYPCSFQFLQLCSSHLCNLINSVQYTSQAKSSVKLVKVRGLQICVHTITHSHTSTTRGFQQRPSCTAPSVGSPHGRYNRLNKKPQTHRLTIAVVIANSTRRYMRVLYNLLSRLF